MNLDRDLYTSLVSTLDYCRTHYGQYIRVDNLVDFLYNH